MRNIFTSGLNAAKIIDYIKKCFVWKLYKIIFHTKKSVNTYLYFPQEWSYGASTISLPEKYVFNQKFNFKWLYFSKKNSENFLGFTR